MPISSVKTEAPLVEPGRDDGRVRRTSMPGRPHVLKAGTVLQNRYRVIEVLGVGGMSTVYRSRDLRFTSVDRLCAVKEMFNSADDPKMRQLRLANFQREAALLATLTHSAIPRIYDYFEQQGTIYLVLELIHGQDLETLLSQRGDPFDEKVIVEWAIRLCSVLVYLHNQQPDPIIFRDLKPSNIMIRLEDSALMLVDFGIARSFAPQQKGTMIGTEGYAPPEQYKGLADPRGDVYALGATLHHLSTGNDPRSETPFTFAQRPPRRLNPALSETFEEIVLKCVAYSAGDRFQSMADVRDALEGLTVQPRPAQRIVEPRPAAAIEVRPVAAIEVRPVAAIEAPQRERSAGSALLNPAVPAPVPVSGAPSLPESRLAWSLKTGDEVRGSATFAGGAVYVGSYDGHLYALDETNGAVRWKFRTQRGIVSRPASFAEMVIFGSEDKSIYAVSRQSGRAIWSYRTNMPVRSSALVDDKWCVIGCDDSFLYRLDRSRGVVVWRYRTWGPVRSSPTAVGEAIFFGSDDGNLYNIHRETGQLTWRCNVGSAVVSSPGVADRAVIVGASDGTVRAAAIADGKLLWSVQTGKTVLASPVVAEGVAYIGSADGHLYAIAAETGETVWKSRVCRQITSTVSIDGDDIFLGGNDSALHCIDRRDGNVRWRFGAGGAIVAKPLLTPDHIIFGSLDGSVYALSRSA